MADFEKALQYVLSQQGMYPYFNQEAKDGDDLILCSSCFNDEGLRLDATAIGMASNTKCSNCGKEDGYKLTKALVRSLCYRFFVRGTIRRFDYGGSPLIQMNEFRFNDSDIRVSPWLEHDVHLIEQAGEIGLFYYGPRFWMFGEIEPLKSLQKTEEIDNVINKILEKYPRHLLNESHHFYRIRLNPAIPYEPSQYDSPPKALSGNNRFDTSGFSIMYASPDLELCIHECRTTVEDELFAAKLVPIKPITMLNLAAVIREEKVTEFNSLDLAIHFLFLAGKHAYPICGHIAKRIKDAGFDGIIYPSYFSNMRTGAVPFETIQGLSVRMLEQLTDWVQAQSVPNIALFDCPVAEKKVRVHSINRVIINSIKYETSFGPAFVGHPVDETTPEKLKTAKLEQITDELIKGSEETLPPS
jgi:hypothetical protein